MTKLTSFMISIVLVSMCIGVFAVFLGQMSNGYGEQPGIDTEDMELLNKMRNISSQTSDIQESVNSITDKDNPFDIIGNFFSSAWGSLKLAGGSLDLVTGDDGLVDTIADKTDMGETGIVIKSGMVTILAIVVVIGIFLATLIKRDL